MAEHMPGSMETQGTLRPAHPFDAEQDSVVLRKAMKGFGTDEKAIIDILSRRSCDQRQQVKKMFKTAYGRDLISDLKSELSGDFERAILALMMARDDYDAYELHRAISGAGTDEGCLIEILCSRNNAQIKQINEAYKRLYKTTLEKDLKGDTSGHFRKLLVALGNANRQEGQAPDRAKAQRDAQVLYQSGEKKMGTDEAEFIRVFASQSYVQLQLVFEEYAKVSKKDISKVIGSEMSGDLEKGFKTLVKVVRNPPEYFAHRIYESMKGLGTDDSTLIRCVVTRCEVDMVQIKQAFQRQYGKTLDQFIKDDCSGNYKKILMALVGGSY